MLSWFQQAGRCLCAIALVLLSLWSTGCTQLFPVSQPSSLSGNSSILRFVPRLAVIATLFDLTDVSIWRPLILGKGLSQTLGSLSTPLGIDFSEDVRPWLGDQAAIAITDQDLDKDNRNGYQTGYLLVAEVSDSERLRESLGLLWQRQSVAGTPLQFTQANGVSIITGPVTSASHQLSTAMVGEHTLLVANDLQVLRRSLQVAQVPHLQLSSPDEPVPLWVALRIPDVVHWLGLAVPDTQEFMGTHLWHLLTASAKFNSFGIAVNTQLQGLQVGQLENRPPVINSVDQTATFQQYLPVSMAWAAMGHDLSPLWANFQTELQHYQKLPTFLRQFHQWNRTDIAQELIGSISQLLANDYGIGQLEDGSWVMAVSSAKPRTLDQLDALATEEGLTVSQFTLNGHTVTAWSRLKTRMRQDTLNRETRVETEVLALRAKLDDCDVFATSLSGLTAVLEAPGQSLQSSQRFQRTVQVMDTPNQGYIYGTWNEMERLLASNRWFSLVQPIVQPWGQSIDAIAITSYGQTINQSTGTVSVLLKK
ncbi:MAG: DUF3352 domain-containing protein [Cyanobacteria bacterium J06642_11]